MFNIKIKGVKKMEIKVIINENFKKATTAEEFIKSLDPYIKEYLDYRKSGYYLDLKNAMKEGKDAVDVVERMGFFTPVYYLYIIPGKETDWIESKIIHQIIENFRLVVIDTMKLERKYVERIKQVFYEDIRGGYECCANQFDYSHLTLAI